MTSRDQLLNIVAFLILMGDERPTVLGKSPDYIAEKWDRYIRVSPPDGPAWNWGLDGGNRAVLESYAVRWAPQLNELFPTKEGETDD